MDADGVSLIFKFVILLILLMLSAFFSSAETALTTVSHIKLKTMAEDGHKGAAKVLKVVEEPNKMLSAILVGNNIVNLSASSLATTVAIKIFGSVGAGIATGSLTLLILIFGEITPKTMAKIKALELSIRYAPSVAFLMWVLTPVIVVVNFLANIVLRICGVDPKSGEDPISEEEIRTIVNASSEDGEIEDDERELIHKIFDFTDATAKEVMIPRIDMCMADVNWSYDELLEVYRDNMYTRLPVTEDDKVIGIINMKDLLFVGHPKDSFGDGEFSIRKYLRDTYYTYEQKKAAELFDEMREESYSLAIVLDEYGGVAGMVTLEDLLEELVGEIRDEYDGDEEDPIVQINAREYAVLGSLNLEDLCQVLPLGFESEDYDTIGGYLTGLFDHFPVAGETYVLEDGTILRIDEVDDKRVTRVRIKFPVAL